TFDQIKTVLNDYKTKFEFDIKNYQCILMNPNIKVSELNELYSIDNCSLDEKRYLLRSVTIPGYRKNLEKVEFIAKQFEPYDRYTIYHLVHYYTTTDTEESVQNILQFINNNDEPIYK